MNGQGQRTHFESRRETLTYPLELPPPITRARIDELVAAGVPHDIAATDLEMVKLKLQHPDEGMGWTKEQCELGELAYKRFLHLNRVAGRRSIVPTKEIDIFWHFHILDTRRYHQDSERLFGRYFHHFPYFGMRGGDDAAALERAFRATEQLWREAFGTELAPSATDCWHDCDGRCWHACDDVHGENEGPEGQRFEVSL
jgi:hypothetical protein